MSQLDESGKDRPIAYASRHLNKTEQKYWTIEKEAAGLIGIKRFKYYLQDEPFTIFNDPYSGYSLLKTRKLDWAAEQ